MCIHLITEIQNTRRKKLMEQNGEIGNSTAKVLDINTLSSMIE